MKFIILILFNIVFIFSKQTFFFAQEYDEHGEIPAKIEDKILYYDKLVKEYENHPQYKHLFISN